MNTLHIAFLWHMHQPYYRDPLTGVYSLPWVRLHALKGYYDMISLLGDFPEIRQTFNLVPSLLRQLEEYSRGEGQDFFLEHSRKPAGDLSPEEKKFILTNFFMCNWETMVRPNPAYWALLLKRGLKIPRYRWDDLLNQFNAQDFRDLQVWFNLAWFGYRSREKKEIVRALLAKGRFFTEEDKAALLKVQLEVIREVIPLYRSALERGQAEITTSPFYHPILPLLIDWGSARRAMPNVPLPGVFTHPEDAQAQIQNGVDYSRSLFGRAPEGLWPSEGSVSPELIPLASRAGIRWMATDEGILFRSLSGPVDRARLYQPYRVRFAGAELSLVFRDRGLSDLIGFTYSKNQPQAAVKDLLGHLREIQRSIPGDREGLVVIALDGENPWESYPDGGRDFLSGLYERLSREPGWRTVTIGNHIKSRPPDSTLDSLHTGSWIDQNFRIWIGAPEDNRAWDCLRRTRDFLEQAAGNGPALSPQKVKLAWEEIYTAEGSDWFWWYGDDFSSDNDEEFDRLFRMHLGNVYLLLGAEVPDFLKAPILLPHEVKPLAEPVDLIAPVLDGQVSNFYEWRQAGYFADQPSRSSMFQGEGFVSGLYYGFDLQNLYFRVDPLLRRQNNISGVELQISLLGPKEWRIVFPIRFSPQEEPYFTLAGPAERNAPGTERRSSIAAGRIVELAVPFALLGLQARERIDFFLTVRKGDLELERHPRSGYLSLFVPGRDFVEDHWQV